MLPQQMLLIYPPYRFFLSSLCTELSGRSPFDTTGLTIHS